MNTYETPTLTRIGTFRQLTKSLGRLNCRDILRFRALWTVTPGC
ncbi:keywimysin-related RiPP [Actinomyces respiraculi]